jgi:hypothetical protein
MALESSSDNLGRCLVGHRTLGMVIEVERDYAVVVVAVVVAVAVVVVVKID